MNIECVGRLVIMSQVMVMVLLVVLSGVGSGVDEGYYPPGTGAGWQPSTQELSCSNCAPTSPQTNHR